MTTVTIEQIAHALGLDEKTIDRDNKSIAESFRAGGIDLTTLNPAEITFVAAVIVVELQKKCPEGSDRLDSVARDLARPLGLSPPVPPGRALSGTEGRARLPRRFPRKPNP